MVVAFSSLLFMSAVWVAEVFFVKNVLDMGDFSYGLLLTTWTVAMPMGSLLIALNTALALDVGLDFNILELDMAVFDAIGLAIAGVMLVLLTVRVFGNLRELAKAEPHARRR